MALLKFTEDVPLAVKVTVPLLVRVLPSAIVNVLPVAGWVIVTLLIDVAVATPSVGVVKTGLVKVLLVRVSVVARPTRVSVLVGNVRVPELTIVAITGAVRVLFVRVSEPAKVAKVPVVGSVSAVVAVAVRVIEKAPAVIKEEPLASVSVALVAGDVMVTLFTLTGVVAPITVPSIVPPVIATALAFWVYIVPGVTQVV